MVVVVGCCCLVMCCIVCVVCVRVCCVVLCMSVYAVSVYRCDEFLCDVCCVVVLLTCRSCGGVMVVWCAFVCDVVLFGVFGECCVVVCAVGVCCVLCVEC